MSYEAQLHALLAPLLQGRLYPDHPPEPVIYPCAVYQQMGGHPCGSTKVPFPNRSTLACS